MRIRDFYCDLHDATRIVDLVSTTPSICAKVIPSEIDGFFSISVFYEENNLDDHSTSMLMMIDLSFSECEVTSQY